MTKQEAFDIVVKHLLTQNKQCVAYGANQIKRCLYRGPDNMKCAIGALIPDELYTPEIEDKSANDLVYGNFHEIRAKLLLTEFYDGGGSFYNSLQSVHDRNDPETWPTKLQEFAEKYDLKYNPPK